MRLQIQKLIKGSLFMLLTLLFLSTKGQVTADFSLNETEGCAPMHIEFANNSTGSNLTYNWDFDNGNISTLENPEANYGDHGVYNITLTVSDGTNTDAITKTLTVYSNPVANFTISDNSACVGNVITFQDVSSSSGSEIVDWIWDFLDGSYPDHSPTIEHSYSTAGVYGASLEVVDENGCRGFVEQLDVVDIASSPVFSYSASPSQACEIPTTVVFESNLLNNSTPPYTYEWDLGDGPVNGQTSMTKTYNEFGFYSCSLRITNGNGCSSLRTIPNVTISEIQSSFSVQTYTQAIEDGDTICPGQTVTFNDNSSGGNNVSWEIDGITYTSSNITRFFNEPGEIVVNHTISGTGCSDSGSLTFYIDEVEAYFGPEYDTICSPYTSLQFNDSSTNAVSWIYVWGDGDSSFVPNPTHAFDLPVSDNDFYGYPHIISLTVTNPRGCSDTHYESFYYNKPFAEFVSDIEEGHSPLDVEFINHSKPYYQMSEFDFTWLHNGVPFSNEASPNYTFTEGGTHEIQLVVSNEEGCIDTSIVREILIGDESDNPYVGIGGELDLDSLISCDCSGGTCYPGSGVAAIFCASETITLTIYDDNPESLFQFDGEGLTHLCSNFNSGEFNINGVVGDTEVSGVIYNYGQRIELPPIPIRVYGPYASFEYTYDCDSPLIYNFIGDTLDVTSFEWDFGDGTTNTTDANPTHHYATTGNYTVQLNTYNNITGCSHSYSEVVVVRDLKADFFIEDELCVGHYMPEITLLQHEYSPVDSVYRPFMWFKDDVPYGYKGYIDTTFSIHISEGLQTIKLVVRDTNLCTDTIVHEVLGLQPHAYFDADNIAGCSPLSSVFSDTSYFQNGFFERFWVIEGDTVSSDEVETYTFENVGTYDVELIVYDSLQCVDNLLLPNLVTVVDPVATISVSDNGICEEESVTFTTNYPYADSIFWYIDTASFVTESNHVLSYTFNEEGNYYGSLVIWQSNCSDSTNTSAHVNVQKATADYSVSDTITDCYAALIHFDFLGDNPQNVVSWTWDFGDNNGPSSLPDRVMRNYLDPGTYHTSLTTLTSNNCSATASLDIVVNGPVGNLLVNPTGICHGESVDFSVYGLEDVGGFVLDYGDGYTSEDLSSTHTYDNEFFGDIHPTLILYSDSENPNLCKVDVSEDLNVHRVVPSFIVHDNTLNKDTLVACHPFDAFIENTSQYASFYQWDLGNGNTATGQDVYELFENTSHTTAQTYDIHLNATYTPFGCYGDTSIQITVLPIPDIHLADDTTICQGDTIQIFASGNTNALLSWNPEELNNQPNIWSPVIAPESQNEYIAAVNLDNCIDSDTIQIYVQDALDVEWSMDTTVIIGQSANIYVQPDQANTFPVWTPNYAMSCDTCTHITVTPLESTTYVFEIQDTLGCSSYLEEIRIEVDEQYSVNLPSSFTPNNDGVNDVVHVRGWGIQELLEFKIFNRWGEEIYSSTDINQGWDGTYRGKVQNIDSYAYMVKAKMYSGQEISKSGTISLLR
jgi:gliding motility-associated-like protein